MTFDEDDIAKLATLLMAKMRAAQTPQNAGPAKAKSEARVPKRLLTAKELMVYLSHDSVGSIYHLVNRDAIPYLKIGRRLFFDPEIIERWIGDHRMKE